LCAGRWYFNKIRLLAPFRWQRFLNPSGGNVSTGVATAPSARRPALGDSLSLKLPDVAAIALFAVAWLGYALAVDGRLTSRVSLTAAMNRQREAWMQTMARRERRPDAGHTRKELAGRTRPVPPRALRSLAIPTSGTRLFRIPSNAVFTGRLWLSPFRPALDIVGFSGAARKKLSNQLHGEPPSTALATMACGLFHIATSARDFKLIHYLQAGRADRVALTPLPITAT